MILNAVTDQQQVTRATNIDSEAVTPTTKLTRQISTESLKEKTIDASALGLKFYTT